MPWSGSGNYTRIHNWQADASAGTKIRADRHDQEDDAFASGISNCIAKDGQSSPTADIPFNGKKITNLAAGINPTDAVNKAQLDTIRTFSTGIVISGSTTNGQVTFSGGTGPTGLSWTIPDISYGAIGTGPTSGQWVWNDKADGTGTNVMALTEAPTLTLDSKDGGAGGGPTLNLTRESPTPAANDVLGVINFISNNSALAKTTTGTIFSQLIDPVAGTEDATMYIRNLVGGAMSERIVLNAAGVTLSGTTGVNGHVNIHDPGYVIDWYDASSVVRQRVYNDAVNSRLYAVTSNAAGANVSQMYLGATGLVLDSPAGHAGTVFTTGNSAGSTASSGYQKFATGVIIQWGQVVGTGADFFVTFPTAFPTACRQITGSGGGFTGVNQASVFCTDTISTVNFAARPRFIGAGATGPAPSSGGLYSWVAIGM